MDIFSDENTVNDPPNEDEERRRVRQAKNAKQAKCMWNAEARARQPPQRNLNGAFIAAADREYATPMGNIAEAMVLLQQLPQNLETQRVMQLTQHVLIQLDRQNPML
jgi:hypothetical protein